MTNLTGVIQSIPITNNQGKLTSYGFSLLDTNFRILTNAAIVSDTTVTFQGHVSRPADVVWARTTASHTLLVSTSAQPVFGTEVSPTGAVTLPVGTYRYSMFFTLSGMVADVNSNATVSMQAGTALITGVRTNTTGFRDTTASARATSQSTSASNSSITNPVLSGTSSTTITMQIDGWFTVTQEGTVIPSVALNAATGTPAIDAGAVFYCERISDGTAITQGSWS